MQIIQALAPGPLDVIGDIHGEIDALRRLLAKLGYDADGRHPQGRRLVFLGDLTDRGPDSPAVLATVSGLVAAGRAQCLLGNHELNLLRAALKPPAEGLKHGNGWWVMPEKPERLPAVPIQPADKARYTRFLKTLPLALERDDLRLVHACWNPGALAQLEPFAEGGRHAGEVYEQFARDLQAHRGQGEQGSGPPSQATAAAVNLKDPTRQPPLLPALAQQEADQQMKNPVAVLTSGEEAPADQPFWAGGKWRMVARVKWWEHYHDAVPVIVGHYWRRYSDVPAVYADKYGPDLFAGIAPHHWMGARRNVYCVDFSVGGRSEQRYQGAPEHLCQLAALRVPEWRVVHDDGDEWEIGAPGR